MNIKAHFDSVSRLGCVVCSQGAELHHCSGGSMKLRGVHRGIGAKVSDWLVIPLCPVHHRGKDGIHMLSPNVWENRFGEQAFFIDMLCDHLKLNLWELALQKTPRTYKRPKKVISPWNT